MTVEKYDLGASTSCLGKGLEESILALREFEVIELGANHRYEEGTDVEIIAENLPFEPATMMRSPEEIAGFVEGLGIGLLLIERPSHPPWAKGEERIESIHDERGSEWSRTGTNMEEGQTSV